ncbi:MAG: YraN family protein [Chloracidobacterium sp.]|nr:YraN family protein [Chloracidobacterium sp.]MDW8216107.1 YraN family protein [Acidobacteriota bacterium]
MTELTGKSSIAGLNRAELGRMGERLAAQFLMRRGLRIAAYNVRLPIGRTHTGRRIYGEIDMVAFDGPTLVFIEVKARTSASVATPESAVTAFKRYRLRRAAQRYRRLIGPADAPYRFDVVAILWDAPATTPTITLFKGFFS